MTPHLLQAQVLPLDVITADSDVQQRVSHVNPDLVGEYAEAIRTGATFPPVVVFRDGDQHWLADGFHRVDAARQAGLSEIQADVRPGGRREAVLFAVGANADHGAQRTNADKRRAVETLLRDPEWTENTDRWIAVTAKVSHPFVAKIRADLSAGSTGNVSSDAELPFATNAEQSDGSPLRSGEAMTRRNARDGRLMNVARIGKGHQAGGEQPAREKAPTTEDAQQVVERFKAACHDLRKIEAKATRHDAFEICSWARDTLAFFMKRLPTRDRDDMIAKVVAARNPPSVSPESSPTDAEDSWVGALSARSIEFSEPALNPCHEGGSLVPLTNRS